MKKFIYLLFVSLFLASCGGEETTTKENEKEAKLEVETTAISVDDLLANSEQYTGKEVLFKGTVDHVCKHSGKRAFVFGSKEDMRIKIEAGGEIRGFDAELIGQDIEVKGKLVETRIDEAFVAKLESDLNQDIKGTEHKEGEENEGETCSAEEIASRQSQIDDLRKKIAASEKGYLSNYYIDGVSYEVAK